MPNWLAIVLGTAAVLTAIGTVWAKLIKPTAELIVLQQNAIPLLRVLVRVFGSDPGRLDVLDEMAGQFRTNGGSSLRDVVNRLDAAAGVNAAAAEVLRIQVEASRLLSVQDREQMARIIILMDRLTVKVDAGDEQRSRMERKQAEVASDLRKSHERADAVDGVAGEASDAASRSGQ